ncbi:7358_t:CDS:1, partial [Scutellospora calospora]
DYKSKEGDTFNKFNYKEDEGSNKVEGYYIEYEKNSTLYLTNIEEISTKDEDNKEESIEKRIQKI